RLESGAMTGSRIGKAPFVPVGYSATQCPAPPRSRQGRPRIRLGVTADNGARAGLPSPSPLRRRSLCRGAGRADVFVGAPRFSAVRRSVDAVMADARRNRNLLYAEAARIVRGADTH